MSPRFIGKERRIVAGIDFGAGSSRLLSTLAGFAKRTGMTVRLVHVIDPRLIHGPLLPGQRISHVVTKVTEDAKRAEAEKRLAECAKSLTDLPVETHVTVGNVADALQADALFHRASLIATGTRSDKPPFLPRGFSTAMSLMASSPLPVLVLPVEAPWDFQKEKLRLLVADDLTDTSVGALEVGGELAIDLGGAQVLHFHVHPASEDELRQWARTVTETMRSRGAGRDELAAVDPEDVVSHTRRELATKLLARWRESGHDPEVSSYQSFVGFGDVAQTLENTVRRESPDLVICGRHQFLHVKPLGLGKVPFYALLGLDRPVMLAPTQRHLP